MGFEVHLGCFRGGEPAGILKDVVRACFPVVKEELEFECWRVVYDEINTCAVYFDTFNSDATLVSWLTVDRPCDRVFDGILEAMRLGPIMLVWPGDSPPLVADESAVKELPDDLPEPPIIVHTAAEIIEAIQKS